MATMHRDPPPTLAGRIVFRSGQHVTPDTLNALADWIEERLRDVISHSGDAARIVHSPGNRPLAELVADDGRGGHRLRLSPFAAVVMGEPLDLSALSERERSLPLPEIPAGANAARIFLELRRSRVVIIPGKDPVVRRGSETVSEDPSACFVVAAEPVLTTGGAAASSGRALEIGRIRFRGGSPTLIPDFVPNADTLSGLLRDRFVAHLAPVMERSSSAARMLREHDGLPPSMRWRLGALAGSGREIRLVLAGEGQRSFDACRAIAAVLAETVIAMGVPRSPGGQFAARVEAPFLLSEALPLNELLDPAAALLAEANEALGEVPAWHRVGAVRVAATPAGTEITAELDEPLGRLVGADCRRLAVAVRTGMRPDPRGLVLFHPTKTREQLLSRYGEISPRVIADGTGFEFEVDLCRDHDLVGERARHELNTTTEILAARRIRVVCPVDGRGANMDSRLDVRFRGVK